MSFTMYVTPYTAPSDPYYTLAASFFAFLPFMLHLFSIPYPNYEDDWQQQEQEQEQDSNIPPLTPTLAWFVSEIEAEILQVLSDSGKEMSSYEIAKRLNYWPENVHTTLYGLYERGVVCMRGDIPLWSIRV